MAIAILKRTLHIGLTAFLAFTMVFFVIRTVGDPARLMLPVTAPESDYQALRSRLGLDQPVWRQYQTFLSSALRGEAGESFWRREPSLPLVLSRMPVTLALAFLAMTFTLIVGVTLGVLAAWRRGSLFDRSVVTFSALTVGIPEFWVAILLVVFVATKVAWLPTSGYALDFAHLLLPIPILAMPKIGRIISMTRANMVEVLAMPYITVARAKGLGQFVLLTKHAFRNALIPVASLAGFDLARWIAGETVVVEAIFEIPGAGLLLIDALRRYDMPVVEASILVFTVATSVVFLAVDLAYYFIDPRIRYD